MTNERLEVSDENLEAIFAGKGLVFDTNVWLRVDGYFTDTADRRSRIYSWFYKKALEHSQTIFLPQVVASEYVKVSLMSMATDAGWKPSDGKVHQHPQYDDWISDVADCLFHVSEGAVRLSDAFLDLDLDTCLRECIEHSIDFNDVLIADLCRRNDLTLVSDDADLAEQPVRIATANKKLLRAS